MSKKQQTTELATNNDSGALAVAQQVNDIFGGEGYQLPIDAPLPQLTILRETPLFESPAGETLKEVVGHIIYWHHANQFYAADFGDSEPGPPACASSDGIRPDGGEEPRPGPCRECPNNEYGSAKEGKGKACTNTIRLYVLQDGDVIPSVIRATPSSLGKKESLMKWLTNSPNIAAKAGMGTKYQVIQARFKLHKKDFSSGFSASVLDVETVRVLNCNCAEDMKKLQALGRLYRDFMTNYLGRIAQDVGSEQTTSETVDTNAADDCPV